jgi:hypothetical protein
MIEVSRKGLGEFPEFIGIRLTNISYSVLPEKNCHRYVLEFSDGREQILSKDKKFDDSIFCLVGMSVTRAFQYFDDQKKKHIFVFEFDEHSLSLCH